MEKMNTRNTISSIVLSFALSFMLCIFAPIEAWYANADEFWFSLGQMVAICAVVFLIVFVVLTAVSYLLSKTKIFNYYLAFMVAMFLFLYVQGNYIPRNYGVMDGHDIDWASYVGYGLASIILVGVCAIAFAVLIMFFKDKVFLAAIGLSVFCFLVQLVTISTLMVQKGFVHQQDDAVITAKGLYDYSKDNNVIVVLLDTYDAAFFNELLEKDYNGVADIFENFTYYKDTVGSYPTTKCALPQILTGRYYKNLEPYADYVHNSYVDNSIYMALEANDYELLLYTKASFLAPKTITYGNAEIGQYRIKEKADFAGKLYEMVAFNYMPHLLKKFFVYDTESISDYKEATTTYRPFSFDTVAFRDDLDVNGITVSKKGNLFKFIHVEGVHAPYTFGRDVKEDGKEYTCYDEAEGCNEILKDLFGKLKDKNIYDRSTIIVMADHGAINYRENPMFLIKNVDEKHGFKISNQRMSYSYLEDVWVSLFNGEPIDEAFVEKCADKAEPRKFYYYNWDDSWERAYMPAMKEMVCEGVAWDAACMSETGNYFYPDTEAHDYVLGEELDFEDGRSAYSHVLYGISYGVVSREAQLKFDISDDFNNLQVSLPLSEKCGDGIVTIYANDNITAELRYLNDDEMISFVIPHGYVADGKLSLRLDQSEDITADSAFESTPLILHSMKIETTDSSFVLYEQISTYKYELGEELRFGKDDNNAWEYLVDGFSGTEEWGTWTDAKTASIKIRVNDNDTSDSDYILNMDYYVLAGYQKVDVYCNDVFIDSYVAEGTEESRTVVIPANCVSDGTLDIRFDLPDAKRPYDLGYNEDMRLLALGFKTLSISKE